jgi:hypothetical protein
MRATTAADDRLAELIARAIGPNDPPANEEQRAKHRQRQIHNERLMNIEWKELTQ